MHRDHGACHCAAAGLLLALGTVGSGDASKGPMGISQDPRLDSAGWEVA